MDKYFCRICGQEYNEKDMLGDVCIYCANSVAQNNGIDLGLGFEDL